MLLLMIQLSCRGTYKSCCDLIIDRAETTSFFFLSLTRFALRAHYTNYVKYILLLSKLSNNDQIRLQFVYVTRGELLCHLQMNDLIASLEIKIRTRKLWDHQLLWNVSLPYSSWKISLNKFTVGIGECFSAFHITQYVCGQQYRREMAHRGHEYRDNPIGIKVTPLPKTVAKSN